MSFLDIIPLRTSFTKKLYSFHPEIMARPRTPNQKKRYAALNKRLAKYVSLVQSIYDSLGLEAARIVTTSTNYEGSKPFRFKDYPQTKASVDALMRYFSRDINALIYSGTTEEWKQSNLVQDLLANDVLKVYGMKRNGEKVKRYYQPNNDALKAFQQRKDKGFTVSQKIWNQHYNFKRELEYAISSGIERGQSAIALSKRISKYLHDFPSLQKDYGERYGHAVDCQNCEYRSIRLARSEINMAYRAAEQTRWQQMDFIKGYEIKLSHSHPKTDVCDQLAGVYPKWFHWTGWHPNDLCYVVPVVMSDDEWYGGNGSEIEDLPENFVQWINNNEERIYKAKNRGTLPYFLRDNFTQYSANTETHGHKSLGSQHEHKPTKHGEMLQPIPMKKAKLDAQQIQNRDGIAKALGFTDEEISQMTPMSFEDADSGNVNALPNKGNNIEDNCQGCVVTFEARFRGLRVTTKGYTTGGFMEDLSNNQTLAWRTSSGEHPSLTAKYYTREDLEDYINGTEIAKNGRYQMGINLVKGKEDGHILCLVRSNGETYFYDGQNNTRYTLKEVLSWPEYSKGIELLRTDKLNFDEQVINLFERY